MIFFIAYYESPFLIQPFEKSPYGS